MITVDWNIAQNITAFIIAVISIIGAFAGVIIKQARMHMKVERMETDLHDTKKELADYKIEVLAETRRMENKFESLQITVTQILQGVSRIQGTLDARDGMR